MRRLHGGDDAELGEARQVGRVEHLDVLDPMAAVAATVAPSCRLVAVQRAVNRGVADRVDGDLQAEAVGSRQIAANSSSLEEGRARCPGMPQ